MKFKNFILNEILFLLNKPDLLIALEKENTDIITLFLENTRADVNIPYIFFLSIQ